MNNLRFASQLTLLTAAALMVANASSVHGAEPASPVGQNNPNQVIATVNGTSLTNLDLAAFARSFNPQQQLSRQDAVRSLVDRELLYQDALAKGMDKNPIVITELHNQKRTVLSNAVVNEMLRGKPATEAEKRKVYQEKVAGQELKEFKARHILVDSETEAKELIAQLDKGGDFSALAKSKSKDRASAERGGDLGWFNPAQMVPAFSQAAAALEKGKYSKKPVQSQFGWHVVLLDDVRKVTPPSYDDVKDRLDDVVQSQHISQYLETLRSKAKIEMK